MAFNLSAWIGAPPSLRNDVALLSAFVEDAVTLLQSFGIETIWTDEPRWYRLTPKGIASLKEAIGEGCVDSLIASDDARCDLSIWLADRWSLWKASNIELEISTDTPAQISDFVQRWFVSLNAAAAFVLIGDYGTFYGGLDWSDIHRSIRGVFWGNAFGPELSERLGGVARIIADAPVVEARPLGNGVWLQASESPPASRAEIDLLTKYLAPLLTRTTESAEQIIARRNASISKRPPQLSAGSVTAIAVTPGVMVPVEIAEDDVDPHDIFYAHFNVHLRTRPTIEQSHALEIVIENWVRAGFNCQFGDARFRYFSDISKNGTAIRWTIETYPAAFEPSVRNLRERLAAIPNVNVVKLVLGIETVG